MPESPVIYQRRRVGGDIPGTVHLRRRDGGDIPLGVRRPATPVTPAGEDVVARFLASRPFYISHRMGGTEYPEFTQAGLDASLRAGFKALEVSVRRCASGEFVAIHDWKTTRTVPGTDYQIWNTPWSTLRTLRQGSGPFMRLSDIVDQVPDDVILAIDHKTTSSEDQRNPGDLRIMAMLYPSEVAGADLSQWDVLGMEWNASADVWNALLASGRPTIAHIIVNAAQAQQALAKGATGLMASYPSRVHP